MANWAGVEFSVVHHRDGRMFREPGLFAVARSDPRKGTLLLFVGQAENLAQEIGPGHLQWVEALQLGMDALHIRFPPHAGSIGAAAVAHRSARAAASERRRRCSRRGSTLCTGSAGAGLTGVVEARGIETRPDERISVVASATSVGVTLASGELQVSGRAPPPSGAAAMAPEQLRTAALRAARRALEVALQELSN